MASQFSQRGHPSIHEEFGAYWTLRMAALNTKLPAGKDVKSAGSLVPSLSTGYPHYPQRATSSLPMSSLKMIAPSRGISRLGYSRMRLTRLIVDGGDREF